MLNDKVYSYGGFTFVLHSHLPYVLSHGKWPHGLDWLNEAAAETYIPLLNVLNEMLDGGFSPKLTIGITPVLAEQLSDGLFKEEFTNYLQQKIRTAENDEIEFRRIGEKRLASTASFWRGWYDAIRLSFEERYHRDLIGAFRELLEAGVLDIITSAATHGYLPLLSRDESIQAQIKVAIKAHEKHFGRRPRGIWLPECAYRPSYRWRPPVNEKLKSLEYDRKGIEEFLAENDIEYFIIDSAMLKGGKAIGAYFDRFEGLKRLREQFEKEVHPAVEDFSKSPYEVYLVNSSGKPEKRPVAVFTRDPRTALQVWSGEHGYPGDGWYLDFHKKYFPGGLRYWRVTGPKSDLAEKVPYEPEQVEERLEENSDHFVSLVVDLLQTHYDESGKRGILTAPYDAELFGHWWFEGTRFLQKVMKKIMTSGFVDLVTASEALDREHPSQVIALPEGSWGEGGYHYIWLNNDTQWTWHHIYRDEARMHELARRFADDTDVTLQELLKQAARELLLLQASDWQFLISTIAARDYSELRVVYHHNDFNRLCDIAEQYERTSILSDEDWNFFLECKGRDSLFPEIDLRWWAELEYPVSVEGGLSIQKGAEGSS